MLLEADGLDVHFAVLEIEGFIETEVGVLIDSLLKFVVEEFVNFWMIGLLRGRCVLEWRGYHFELLIFLLLKYMQ